MIWSISSELSRSWLHFSLLPVYGTVLAMVFLHSLTYFAFYVREFNKLIHFMHQIMFASLPLLSASVLSLYLCDQMEALELSACFTAIYYLYAHVLCWPRTVLVLDTVRSTNRVGRTDVAVERPLLPAQLLRTVACLPILFSTATHIAMHHSFIMRGSVSALAALQALLLPLIGANVILKNLHMAPAGADAMLTVCCGIYALTFIRHPMFDDLRHFGSLDELVADYLMHALVIAVGMSAISIRRVQAMHHTENEEWYSRSWVMMLRVCCAASTSTSMALLCVLIGMPLSVMPFCLLGTVALTELYFQLWPPMHRLILAMLASGSLIIVLPEFFKSTIYYIAFNFAWHVDLTMKQLCNVFIVITVFYLLLPAVLDVRGGLELLPTALAADRRGGMAREVMVFFSLAFIAFSMLIAGIELMLLEQHWSSIGLPADEVYPQYFFFGTAMLLGYLGHKLRQKKVIGISTMGMVWSMQLLKVLHYASLPSEQIASLWLMSVACALPFVRQLSEYMLRDAAHDSTLSPQAYVSVSNAEIVGFIALNTAAAMTAGRRVGRLLLTTALKSTPTDMQTAFFSASVWALFISTILLVFFRKQKLFRGLFLAMGAVMMILAFDGFGSNQSLSSIDLPNDHSFMFMLMCSAMTAVAWSRAIPLEDAGSCFIYSLIFGFASTKAMLAWALPIYPGAQLSHDVRAFPFLCLYVGKTANTFVVLWTSKDRFRGLSYPLALALAIAWPFLAFSLSIVLGYPPALQHGIIWSSIVSTASTCCSFRLQQVLAVMRGTRSNHAYPTPWGELSLVLVLAMLCMTWTLLAVFHQVSAIDSDVFFPLSAVLLLLEDSSFMPSKVHPARALLMICSLWWCGSAVYHIFLRGLWDDVLAGLVPYSLFGWDEEISIWLSSSLYLSALNAFLALLPLPAIMASAAGKRVSAEMCFILAVSCVAPVIGGSVDCVRYLGLAGMVSAGYRCYQLSSSGSKAKHSVI